MRNLSFACLLLLTLALPVSVRAQYYSVNVDYKTMAAMSEAFSTEAAMEALHNENLQKIYDSYKAAEVATAGIFASKYLDRKALTSLNLWDDRNENYYYTRIYNLVTRRIIPKTVECAELMIEDPATAIYWGSYLVKTCEDVKSLCKQFESVVTNGRLSFQDITFVEISDQLKSVFNITNLGGVDWKDLFEHLGDDLENAFSKEGLKSDLETLMSKGVGLAGAGYSNGVEGLLQGTDFGGSFQEKLGSILTLADNATSLYDDFKNLSTKELLTQLGGEGNVADILNLQNYNLTNWITDYSESAQGQYYTQRVYIYRQESGTEQLCSYTPPTDDDAILYGGQWYRVGTDDPSYAASTAEREAALSNSENYAGWSRSRVKQLNADNTKYTYDISYWLSTYVLSKKKSGQYAKAYAYSISVSRSWCDRETVYEEVFDSYSQDWNTFIAQMKARLQSYNANGDHTEISNTADLQSYIDTHAEEPTYTYYIGYDDRHYYTASDAKKVSGCSSATFTLTCHDGGTLGSGSTTYKCGDCGKTLSEHTKDCSMYTTLSGTDDGVDMNQLTSQLSELQSEASSLQARIDELNAENSALLRSMSTATNTKEYESYRTQYNANSQTIKDLESQLDTTNQSIKDTQQAIDEAEDGEKAETDDYNRIPQLMKSMQDAYGITWTGNGSWTGYTFVREGTVGSVKGRVTFKASLSIARKPKTFMGMKIHRAIVQIDWELTSSWSDSSVAEILQLDTNKSDEENASLVNQKMSELAQEYPTCDITVEYNKADGVETEDTDGTYHLLWASDRLEIARDIEARLAKVYTDLVQIEKFLHYRHTYKMWAKDLLPKLNADQDKKLDIAEQCRRRWMFNGGSKEAIYRQDDENEE